MRAEVNVSVRLLERALDACLIAIVELELSEEREFVDRSYVEVLARERKFAQEVRDELIESLRVVRQIAT